MFVEVEAGDYRRVDRVVEIGPAVAAYLLAGGGWVKVYGGEVEMQARALRKAAIEPERIVKMPEGWTPDARGPVARMGL